MRFLLSLCTIASAIAVPAGADPLADFQQHCVRPLVQQRCVLADADAAGLREVKPRQTPADGTMAFRLNGRAQLLFSSFEAHRCHVFAPRMKALPALPANPPLVAISAQWAPGGGVLLTAETAPELAAPMAR
jgi:hypothetical protein